MIISDLIRSIRNVPMPEPGAPPIKPETTAGVSAFLGIVHQNREECFCRNG